MYFAVVLLTLSDPNTQISIAERTNQAHALYLGARYEEAELEYRSLLLEANRSQRAVILNNLAMLLKDRGRTRDAFAPLLESLQIRELDLGKSHPETMLATSNLASLYGAVGEWDKAGRLYRQVAAALPNSADAQINLALIEKLEGHYAASIAGLQRALAILDATPNASPRSLVAVHNNLASQLVTIGQTKPARGHLEEAMRLSLATQGPTHPTYALLLESKAGLDIATKRYADARAAVQQAGTIKYSYREGSLLKLLAWIDFHQSHYASAESRVAQALPLLANQPVEAADAHFLLARLRVAQRRKDAAIDHLECALRLAHGTHPMLTLYAELMRERERYHEAAKAEQAAITIETRSALARTQTSHPIAISSARAQK